MRDLKHKVADKALSFKENHETLAVEYVRELAAADEEVKDIAQNTLEETSKATTSAERFWVGVCKDAHRDHAEASEPSQKPEGPGCGTLQVEVLNLGEETLVRADGKPAAKPVLVMSLHGNRSGALRPGTCNAASFQVMEVLGSDLGVYAFDRGSSKFAIGMEDQAFCGGCLVPLTTLTQRCMKKRFWDVLRSSFSQQVFQADVKLQLLPLHVVRGKWKLEPGEVTGASQPKVQLGSVVLRLTLSLDNTPALLCFRPSDGFQRPAMVESHRGHVSDPFSVLKAAGLAVGRISFALKMDLWKATVDDMRDSLLFSPLLVAWWTLTVLVAPLWTWPFLVQLALSLFAWRLYSLSLQAPVSERRRLYADEGGGVSKDLMKEAMKAQLHIMQLTDSVNAAASQIEKVKFIVAMEDRCLSTICLAAALAISFMLCLPALMLHWIMLSGFWRYLLWLPGSCAVLPKALRSPIFQFLSKLEQQRQELMGNDLERILEGFWQRMPNGTEASHLYLFKEYVLCDDTPATAQ
ncbi:unnamed protein product [Symbiodinium pilosum]|uniref:Phosphoribosyltransferase C-terminal domain-containing protein n=1 Tax=Symbiodinium pilosum TaxID=2952 RepID=A0A812JR88_SYMPI|nr:unnamed protein product [Symbiodinium pilosum]